jgi:hypothetical protein
MAVVAHTEVTKRLPVGDRVQQTYRTSALGTGAADEWIATGLSWIDAVVGAVVIGTAGDALTINCVKNARGTGVAAGTNAGDLGVEVSLVGTNVIEVTVIGIP